MSKEEYIEYFTHMQTEDKKCMLGGMASKGEIETLTLYDDMWLNEEDYRDKLSDDLCDEEEYKDLSDEEYEKMLDQKIAETEFVKAIVIWVG